MAGRDRTTNVRQVMREKHGDVIRVSIRAVARELPLPFVDRFQDREGRRSRWIGFGTPEWRGIPDRGPDFQTSRSRQSGYVCHL